MQVYYFNSFLRSFRKLSRQQQDNVSKAMADFVSCLENKNTILQGMGLKKLTAYLWEIRSAIDLRIVLTTDSDVLNFVFTGNHGEIRKYIRHNK